MSTEVDNNAVHSVPRESAEGPCPDALPSPEQVSSQAAPRHDPVEVRKRLESFAASTASVLLDPRAIGPAPWANRHPCSLRGAPFDSLKSSIAKMGGNVVPILVRKSVAGGYEIVYGRRRRQACEALGLPVKAVIWEGELRR